MKNIVITGGTRGLGLCMAREFLRMGCSVTVSGKSEKSLEAAAQALDEYKGRVLTVPCDVRKKPDIEHLWEASAEKWGHIDAWINNAGQNCPFEYAYDTAQSDVDAVIDTNLKGMIYCSQIAAKRMLAQKGGQVWNMEGLGSNDMIQAKTILYGTTKHALTYFTKGLAKELAGTPVMAGRLSPGMMLTDFILKAPDGEKSPAIEQKSFRSVFNVLADRPETVAAYFIPRILANRKNGAHIVWLSNAKAMARFMSPAYHRRRLL